MIPRKNIPIWLRGWLGIDGVKFLRKLFISLMYGASCFAVSSTVSLAAEITQPKAVVELFTSQGCHSCPPADKIIGEYSQDPDVLGLSWHVDYWDYLGWKDVFASKANTQRQYAYARSLKESQVYTPQAVINGRTHAVGSRKGDIKKAITAFNKSNRGMIVPIKVTMTDSSIKITIDNTVDAADATLYMVFFNKEQKVKIKRGENGGKTLTYHNVVHDSQALGMVKANGLEMEFPMAEMKRQGYDGCALILQKSDSAGNPSAIVGATVITDL